MYGIEPISSIIDRKARKTSLGRSVEATRICQLFMEAVIKEHPRMAEKTEPLHVKNKTLLVALPTSAWANELLMCQHKLIKYINAKLGTEAVKRVRYQIRRK